MEARVQDQQAQTGFGDAEEDLTYGDIVWTQFKRNRVAMGSLYGIFGLVILGTIAPLLASNQPFVWELDGERSYPWFTSLFNRLVFENPVDIFFNLLLVLGPILLGLWILRVRQLQSGSLTKRARRRSMRLAGGLLVLLFLLTYGGIISARHQATYTTYPLLMERIESKGQREVSAVFPPFDFGFRDTRFPPLARPNWYHYSLRATWAPEGVIAQNDDDSAEPGIDPKHLERTFTLVSVAADNSTGKIDKAALRRGGWDGPFTVRRGRTVIVAKANSKEDISTIQSLLQRTYSDLDVLLVDHDGRHVLGVDNSGRDVGVRLLYGIRVSLTIGVVAVAIYVTIGVILGASAGFFGGRVDLAIQRLIEIFMCMPVLFVIITLIAFLEQASIFHIMVLIGVLRWTGVARLTRGEFLRLRNQDFVTAAEALGYRRRTIIFKQILPNALGPVLVAAAFGVAAAILLESTLSFLGLGDVSAPSWGQTLKEGYSSGKWHLILSPGFAIFFTVSVLNLVGEGLRDALDPKLRQ